MYRTAFSPLHRCSPPRIMVHNSFTGLLTSSLFPVSRCASLVCRFASRSAAPPVGGLFSPRLAISSLSLGAAYARGQTFALLSYKISHRLRSLASLTLPDSLFCARRFSFRRALWFCRCAGSPVPGYRFFAAWTHNSRTGLDLAYPASFAAGCTHAAVCHHSLSGQIPSSFPLAPPLSPLFWFKRFRVLWTRVCLCRTGSARLVLCYRDVKLGCRSVLSSGPHLFPRT